MASDTTRQWFRPRGERRQAPQARVLTAAATRLDLGNRKQAQRTRALRQGWQLEAWAYRDSIGELRYAINYLANCTARMRVFPAAYTDNETDAPVPVADAGAPPSVIAACEQAMKDLGNGKKALAPLLHSLSTNIAAPGEGFLLGREDPETGIQEWTVRSIDEIIVYNDDYKLREIPMDPQGILGWEDLNPDYTIVSRMWQPHPRFRMLADSPLRAIMDDCESLLILRRMIRATGRSRLAGRGILALPDELSLPLANNDDGDPQADPFLSQLTDHLVTPISDEGTAASVVPLILRGPGDILDKIRLIEFASQFDEMASATRSELVGIIATGFDLPKEIITGVADLNHWSAWQVDDSTFRAHVEPHVITVMDCLTSAYLRPYLESAEGLSPEEAAEWSQRVTMWYDPSELVTNPNQGADALQLHDRKAISNEALRRVTGFSEADAPDKEEFITRLISDTKTWPPNALAEILHQLDPTLAFPPITVAGTIPGVKAGEDGGVDLGEPPSAAPSPPVSPSAVPEPGPSTNPPPEPTTPAHGAPEPVKPEPAPVTASGVPRSAELNRLSRKLTNIDRDLRAKLQVAANAALLRQLEKAGHRIRSKMAKDPTARAKIAHTRNELVASVIGREAVEASGLTAAGLTDIDLSQLKDQFYAWTADAQRRALATAAQMAGLGETDEALSSAAATFAHGLDAAWTMLSEAIRELAHNALYSPLGDVALEDLSADSMVPTGLIRCSLAVAGGAAPQDFGMVMTRLGAEVPAISLGQPIGQIGTSSALGDLLTSQSDLTQTGFSWVHGSTVRPFEPHESFDEEQFTSFDDEALANDGDWPDVAFFTPGDHEGCTCDYFITWDAPTDSTDAGAGADALPEMDDAELEPA